MIAKIFVLLFVLTIAQQAFSLECYFCTDYCDQKAAEIKTCGFNIGPNHEALCVRNWKKDKDPSKESLRKCVVAEKNKTPSCNVGHECDFCREEKCNSASTIMLSLLSVVGLVFGQIIFNNYY